MELDKTKFDEEIRLEKALELNAMPELDKLRKELAESKDKLVQAKRILEAM